MPRPTPEHGTDGGYQRHRRLGEAPCQPCRDAHAALNAGVRARKGATPRRLGPEHGTRAAYERERRAWKAGHGPEPCDRCRAAYAAYRAARRST